MYRAPCYFGFDHINRNPPVLIRTPKLTRFEPAQYWGGGPPGNSVVLNPKYFFSFGRLIHPPDCLLTSPSNIEKRKFGRVVKALALGASLERGTGSNPVACIHFCQLN